MESKLQQRRNKVKEERASSVNSNRLEVRRREYRESKQRASTPEKVITRQNLTINVDDILTPEVTSYKVKPHKRIALSYVRPNGRKDEEEYIVVNEAVPESPGMVPIFTKQPLAHNHEKVIEKSKSIRPKKVWTLGKAPTTEAVTDSFSEDRDKPEMLQRSSKPPSKKSPSPETVERGLKNDATVMFIKENTNPPKVSEPYNHVEKLALKVEEASKSPLAVSKDFSSSSKKQLQDDVSLKDNSLPIEPDDKFIAKKPLPISNVEDVKLTDRKPSKQLIPLIPASQLLHKPLTSVAKPPISRSKGERKSIQYHGDDGLKSPSPSPDAALRIVAPSPKASDNIKLKKEQILPRAPATKEIIEISTKASNEQRPGKKDIKKQSSTNRDSGNVSRSRSIENVKLNNRVRELKSSLKTEIRSEGRPESRLDRKAERKPPSRRTSPRNVTGKKDLNSATEADTILSSLSLIILQKKGREVGKLT